MASTRFRTEKQRNGPSFSDAYAQLKAGVVLRLEYYRGLPRWELGGREVSPEVIALLVSCSDVVADSDALIPGMPAQSWRIRS